MSIFTTLVLPLFILGLLVWFLGNRSPRFSRLLVALGGAHCFVGSLAVFVLYSILGGQSQSRWAFVHEVSFLTNAPVGLTGKFGLDGLSALMVLLCGLVGAVALWVSAREDGRPGSYYGLLFLIVAGAFGAFTSLDLFYMYVFHELALIPTFVLMWLWGRGSDRKRQALVTTIYLNAGALVVLVGLIWLYLLNGYKTFDFTVLTSMVDANPGTVFPASLGWVFVVGFGILATVWPFYGWAPGCYGTAPIPVTMLHAGVLKIFGLYGLLRVDQIVGLCSWPGVGQLLAWLGVGNVVAAGLIALRQRNLNDVFTYGSIAHVGIPLLGMSAGTELSLTGSYIAMVGNGIWAALAFATVGLFESALGTADMAQLAGLGKRAKNLAALLIVVAFAGCGLPGFLPFVGEILVLLGTWGEPVFRLPAVFVVAGVLIVGSVYLLAVVRKVVQGSPALGEQMSIPLLNRLPSLVLACVILLFGIYPKMLTRVADPLPARGKERLTHGTKSQGSECFHAPGTALVDGVEAIKEF